MQKLVFKVRYNVNFITKIFLQCFHSTGDIGDIMPERLFTEARVPATVCANFTITNETDFEGPHTVTVEIADTSPAPSVVSILLYQ